MGNDEGRSIASSCGIYHDRAHFRVTHEGWPKKSRHAAACWTFRLANIYAGTVDEANGMFASSCNIASVTSPIDAAPDTPFRS